MNKQFWKDFNRIVEYQRVRNKQVLHAEKHADELHGKNPPEGVKEAQRFEWYNKWNKTFYAEMDRLCEKAGIKIAKRPKND